METRGMQCPCRGLLVQEFNLEKLQLVEQEKAKIRKDYERREGQVEVKKKMCVLQANPCVHAMRCPASVITDSHLASQRILQAAQRDAAQGAGCARGRYPGDRG